VSFSKTRDDLKLSREENLVAENWYALQIKELEKFFDTRVIRKLGATLVRRALPCLASSA
jgi:hypothetical protein